MSSSSSEDDEPRKYGGRRLRKVRGGKRNAALDELRQLKKHGIKRSEQFDLGATDDKLYDVVDEEEYKEIVRKRREEGDFVVDDDGTGYLDDGEEHHWEKDDYSDTEDMVVGGKRKLEKKKKKKKAEIKALSVPKSQSISSMFVKMANNNAKKSEAESKKSKQLEAQVEASLKDTSLDSMLSSLTSKKRTTSKHRSTKKKSKSARKKRKTFHAAAATLPPAEDEPEMDVMDEVDDHMEEPVQSSPEKVESKETSEPLSNESSTDAGEEKKEEVKPPVKLDAKSRFLASAKRKPIKEKAVATTPVLEKASTTFMSTPPVGKQENLWNHSGVGGIVASTNNSKATLPLETRDLGEGKSETVLRMFWLDLYEDAYNIPGKVFLLGKVWSEEKQEFLSCCVEVCNIERVLLFLPRDLNKKTGDPVQLADVHAEVKSILNKKLHKDKGRTFRMKMVKRKYAFELPNVPRDEHGYLKVKYPMGAETGGPLSQELSGDTFSRVFGARHSATERIVIGRDLMGPCWLELKDVKLCERNKSWCKFMVTMDDPKSICKIPTGVDVPAPPTLNVLSLALKTVVNPKTHAHEVVMISGMFREAVAVDGETKDSASTSKVKYFTALRTPGSNRAPLPFGFKQQLQKDSKLSSCITIQSNECALLNFFMAQLARLDPDVLLGHNISGFELDVLVSRMQANRIKNWSMLGRLRRDKVPKAVVVSAGHEKHYGNLTPGRLLLDSYTTAKELLFGQRSYSLTELCRTQLNMSRNGVDPQDVPLYYNSSDTLLNLVRANETDAWLTLQLAFKLEALPLTLQLTNLGGNLWQRTLSGGRAERIEYLLLHEFHRNKFVLPDKIKKKSGGKKKGRNKKAAYAGGLVLEPKKGLYDTYILLLDFNSLYPSIIQEYNICYTTVVRPAVADEEEDNEEAEAEEVPALPDRTKHPGLAILPSVIRTLVERRKVVKKMIKQEKNASKLKTLDVRQKALKIIANSMYGCLGFSQSRFFAKPVAALVTSQGREILQNTVATVEKKGLDVVYGDTDSIMINTNTTDLAKVKEIGQMVKREINKLYKLLEIEQDGVFKTMLLLKKKKYAALLINETVDSSGAKVITTTKEVKGLDLVRRDWATLSKSTGHKVLNFILSGKPCEEVVDGIHDTLTNLAKAMRAKELKLKEYVITKGLNKSPKDYPDAKGQPHLQVAIAMMKAGKPVNTGDHIPYVICNETRAEFEAAAKKAESKTDASDVAAAPQQKQKKSYAQRAFHPDEVERANGKLTVDIEWYLAQQIMPPVQRLCDPIAGTSAAQLAECLGLDASKFNHYGGNNDDEDEDLVKITKIDDAERYKDCERVMVQCEECKVEYAYPGVFSKESAEWQCGNKCTSCGEKVDLSLLNNKLLLEARKAVEKYYAGYNVADDPSAELRTRQQSVRGKSWLMNGRRVQLEPEYPARTLYEQLKYIESLVDCERADSNIAKENERRGDIKQEPIKTEVLDLESRKQMEEVRRTLANTYTNHSAYAFVKPSLFKTAFRL